MTKEPGAKTRKQPTSIEQYRAAAREAHAALLSVKDGLSLSELSRHTNLERALLKLALEHNPLFYVDRWEACAGTYTRVWCANVTHCYEDCPRPERTKQS